MFLNNLKNVTSDCDQDTANIHLEDSYSDSKSYGFETKTKIWANRLSKLLVHVYNTLESLMHSFHTSLISYSEKHMKAFMNFFLSFCYFRQCWFSTHDQDLHKTYLSRSAQLFFNDTR